MTLEQNIVDIMQKKLEDGTIEKIVEEKLTKAIDDAVSDLFKWNGDGKKSLDEKIKSVMVPVIEKHDFSEYITKLDCILSEIINKTNLADNTTILENFKNLMIEPTEKVIDVTKIFEKYKKYVLNNVDKSDLEYCDGYSYVEVKMSFDEIDDNRYFKNLFTNAKIVFECKVNDEEVENLEYTVMLYKYKNKDNDWSIKLYNDIDINSLRYLSEFEVFMMQLNRSFVKVKIDDEYKTEEVEIEEEY